MVARAKSLNSDEFFFRYVLRRIWNRKRFISFFVFLGLFISLIYLNLAKEIYSSQINIELLNRINQSPIQNLFYKKDYFDLWKKSDNNDDISFNSIDRNYFDKSSGYFFLNSNKNFLVEFFEKDKKNPSDRLVIRTNDLKVINSIRNYLNFLNELMQSKEISILSNRIKRIFDIVEKFPDNQQDFITHIKTYNKQIDLVKTKGLYEISLPTKPSLIKPKKSLSVFLGITLGGLFGILALYIQVFFKERQ